jgi:hypothetical protein
MLGWLANKVTTARDIYQAKQNPILVRGREAIRTAWTGNPQNSRHFGQQLVELIATKMANAVLAIASAPDPRMANRELLVNATLELARYDAVLLSERDPVLQRGTPGLSGKLRLHIEDIARKDERFRQELVAGCVGGIEQANKLIPEQIRDFFADRSLIALAWANMSRAMRLEWTDYTSPDWFDLLRDNLTIWEESQIRKLLGLEQCFGGRYPDMEPLKCWTLVNFVMSGAPDPVGAWRENYRPVPLAT